MRVCIVTVYNSINCGSYWQAFALGEAIKGLGHEVVYWKRKIGKDSSASFHKKLRHLTSCFMRGGIKGALSCQIALREFTLLQRGFEVTENQNDIDCYVLGSDTIWDVTQKYFKANYKTFWGIDFFPGKVLSYAPSVANAEPSDLTDEMYEAIHSLFAVSVRDAHSFEVIRHVKEGVQIVGDPTLLMKKEDYQQYMMKKRTGHYVYLYLFSGLGSQLVDELKAFCKKNGLYIVIGSYLHPKQFSNEGGTASPNSFITDLFYAEYVITDTFHGTIFSILFNKQFVSVKRNKIKVRELLSRVGLEDRFVDQNITDTLAIGIAYDDVNARVNQIREDSILYLRKNLS